jgi:predicted kinase
MLIVFGGLPGTGKTTVARALAQKLGAVYLRIDTIEQALRSHQALKTDVGPSAYIIGYRLAEDNLRIGRIVITDSVNPLQMTRDAWVSVAERAATKAAEVEVICSDTAEHRRRIETRRTDIEKLRLPTWQDVIGREYENWDRQHIVIDTASKTASETVAELLTRLGFAFCASCTPKVSR